MTSLAKQLQKLAIPGQPSLRQVVSKKKPSLLFDAKEAADIDIDTIFSLGVNGLEELITIDQTFAEFESSLFQESCKDFERTVQMKEILEDVDEKISSFLRKLSPYFLLKPAQKCLEWLIRVFRINSFNVDAIMECILPYYQTNLFARVVQLLPLKDPSSSWHWLRPIQKAGSPLSKLTLVQHCISTQPFLVFVCEMVPRSLKAHKYSTVSSTRTVVAFYVSTVVSVLETASSVSEELMSRLLPFIVKGLKSSNVEYRAASYMVTSRLCTEAKLQAQLYCSLIETICKHLGPELVMEGLGCVAVVCITQQVNQLSKKTVKHLLNLDTLVLSLSQLYKGHPVAPLITALLSSLLEYHFKSFSENDNVLNVLLSLIEEIKLEEAAAYLLVKELLDKFSEVYESLGSSRVEENTLNGLGAAVGPLAQSLDAKYPSVVDKALEDVFASFPDVPVGEVVETSKSKRRKMKQSSSTAETDWLRVFISLALPQSRHQLLEDGTGQISAGSTLVLSVHHPNPLMRAAAVKQLGKSLTGENQEMDTDKNVDSGMEFVESSLLERLKDDDPTVVQAVLHLTDEVLFTYLPADELVSSLCNLLTRGKLHKPSNSEWQSCALLAIDILMSQSFLDSSAAVDRVDDVITSSLPLLFVHRHGNIFAGKVAAAIQKTSLAKQHLLFSDFNEVLKNEAWIAGCDKKSSRDTRCLAAATELVVDHLGKNLAAMSPLLARKIIFKILSAEAIHSPGDQASYYTLLSVVGCALKYLPAIHSSETDTHEQALRLQMAVALHLIPHIRNCLSTIVANREDFGDFHFPEKMVDVFAALTAKHPDKRLGHVLLLLWLLKILAEHLVWPPKNSTSMWLEIPVHIDTNGSDTASLEPLFYRVMVLLFSLLTHCINGSGTDKANGRTAIAQHLVNPSKHLLQTVLTHLFTVPGSLLRFLAMIWTVPIGMELELPSSMSDSSSSEFDAIGISLPLQVCSLAIAGVYLQSLPIEVVICLVGAECPVVPSLLVPLMNSHKVVREGALNCIATFQQAIRSTTSGQCPIGSSPFMFLIEKIAESKLELATDPSYLQQLLGGLLSISNRSNLASTKTKKRKKQSKVSEAVAGEALGEDSVRALDCLLNHLIAMGPLACVQHTLLRALEHVEHPLKLDKVLPLLIDLLERSNTTPAGQINTDAVESDNKSSDAACAEKAFPLSPHEYLTLKLCIGMYSPKMAAHLQSNADGFQLLVKLIRAHSFDQFVMDVPSPREVAIKQVTPAFFENLSNGNQQDLIQHLIDALLHTKSVQVGTLIKSKMKMLKLSSELVMNELQSCLNRLGGIVETSPKKRTKRQSMVLTGTPEDGPWKRLTILLELIQQTSDAISNVHLLPPILFNLLNKSFEVHKSLNLDYTQQLLLSCLLGICSSLIAQGTDEARELLVESQFNVELVVQCIRSSSNPQTHHHALLLLSTAAVIFPNRILHNIMPIFTFMGAHLLHQDDQYSFQVIAKTIDTVIPPLIKSGSAIFSEHATSNLGNLSKYQPVGATTVQPSSVEGAVTEIIHVFVDALPHVPDHRRLPLFHHLLTTVGVEEYLHVALGLLVEKQVVQASPDQQVTKDLDATFSVSLALEFPMKNILLGMLKLAEHFSQLPDEKPRHMGSKLRQIPATNSQLFNFAAHTDQQLKQYKLAVLSLLLSLLSQKVLTNEISLIDIEDSDSMEVLVVKLLECILGYASNLSQSQASLSSQAEAKIKFQKALLKKTYLVVDKVFALLSVGSFVAIITQLLSGPSPESGSDIQRKTVEILNSKLEGGKLKLQREHDEALLTLVETLLEVAKLDSNPTGSRHSALHGIQLLTSRLGSRYSDRFLKVAQVIGSLCREERQPSKVTSGCLVCMSELVKSLGPHAIPLLPSLLPSVLKHLSGKKDKARNDSLQHSAACCLATITETLPKFLSSFINDIITSICQSKMVHASDELPNQLLDKLAQIRLNMSVLVPCRTLLPAYHKCYPNLVSQGKDSVCALLGMLSSTVSELKKQDIRNHSTLLIQIFITTLDYRAIHGQLETTAVEAVESCCVEAFSLLVVKLSEALFRPMFLQLLDWATHPSSPKDRLITFYHLTDCIADKLKNLFLLFAGHMLKSIATLFDSNHVDKEGLTFFDGDDDSVSVDKSCLLLRYILQTLTKCFLYDKSSFLTKERFDTLLQPLVNQVTNTTGGAECYRKRVESQLAPCLAYFAVAAGKDSLWKPLNQQLLVKSRHSESQVRFALLKVLEEIYTKLGEEFIILLPETIPFLAELMEDESEEVEQEAQKLISIIENIMGESIQQYF